MAKRSRDATEEEAAAAEILELLLFSSSSCGSGGVAKARKSTERTFECKTCSRRFATFQALGGHCTTHKRSSRSSVRDRPKKRRDVHECTVCGMGFSMGQALGGHMRRHKPMVPAVISPCQRSRSSQEKVWVLDLNSPPPPEEEEDELAIVHFLNFI